MNALRGTWQLIVVMALVVVALVAGTRIAVSDTPGCVSRGEYENLVVNLSEGQVANRFDTNGWFIGTGDHTYRRGYTTCWAPNDRKVVVWYDLSDGLTSRWDVRDA